MTRSRYELDENTHGILAECVGDLVRREVASAQALREAQRLANEKLAAFCLELLAALDALEAQVNYLAAQPREAPWPRLEKNLRVTSNKFRAALAAQGASPLEISTGDAPDYRLCVAVEKRVVEGLTGERIAEVLRSGWSLEDSVLRAAEVVVEVPAP